MRRPGVLCWRAHRGGVPLLTIAGSVAVTWPEFSLIAGHVLSASRVHRAGQSPKTGLAPAGGGGVAALPRTGIETRTFEPDVMSKLRTSASGSAEDAGYQFARPPPMIQLPAVAVRAVLPMTMTWHVVPTGIPDS
jgi:hypothetical protein